MLKRVRAKIRFMSVIRESFAEANGDADEALRLFEGRLKGVDPATIVWLIKLAWEIYKLWESMRVKADDAAEATIPGEMMRSVKWEALDFLGE